MIGETTITAVISGLAGIIIAYITTVVAKQRKTRAPKDRMENIFDGYEGLIRRQDEALNYKDQQLRANEDLLRRMQKQIDDMGKLMDSQRRDLESERTINQELHDQLDTMRKQYGVDKAATGGVIQ